MFTLKFIFLFISTLHYLKIILLLIYNFINLFGWSLGKNMATLLPKLPLSHSKNLISCFIIFPNYSFYFFIYFNLFLLILLIFNLIHPTHVKTMCEHTIMLPLPVLAQLCAPTWQHCALTGGRKKRKKNKQM